MANIIKIKYDSILGFRYIDFQTNFLNNKVENYNSKISSYGQVSNNISQYHRKSFNRNGNNRNVLLNKAKQIIKINKGREKFGFSKKRIEHYSKLISKLK